jgi:hypothetical protein
MTAMMTTRIPNKPQMTDPILITGSPFQLAGEHGSTTPVARQGNSSSTSRHPTTKFAGSGGAIIGLYEGETMYEELRAEMAAIGSRVIKPQVS